MTDWLPPTLPSDYEHRVGDVTLRFVPLTPALVAPDYAAVMRDPAMLHAWSASDWPVADFTLDDNLADLVVHDDEQRDRIAITYSVLLARPSAEFTVQGCTYA